MKNSVFVLLAFLNFTCLFGQPDVNTSGDNSPAVIAENLSVTYGVRADAIEAILWIYEAEGYGVERRKRATEQILWEYRQSPEKQQQTDELSETTRRKIGITDAPQITNALEWDLFARNHYLSTTGHNSPAVVAKGDVNIWYGISPKALRALAAQLEKNKTDFEAQLGEQAKKYQELKTELETYGSQEEIYRQAEALLEEGKLEEAEQLIEADFDASMKRQAYKGYIYGKTKELLLKYDEAAKGYLNAIQNDEGNSTYHLSYAFNENTLAHYDEAIRHLEIALRIDSLKSENEERIATLINNLGATWREKGEYDKAIEYLEKSLQIDLQAFGENHPNVANRYSNLGAAWHLKGEYDKAIQYYEKALPILLQALGENHPTVAREYNNLGVAWREKGEYDKAIQYYEKALQIDLQTFDKNHPTVATRYNNLGLAWSSKGEYDKAIQYYEKSLQIDLQAFGENHPTIATPYNNLGLAWSSKDEYDKAIQYYEKALPILLQTFGENHPNVAGVYNNLGSAWSSKGEYDIAIQYYEKCQIIVDIFLEPTHPHQKASAANLSSAANSKGMELYREKKYQEALSYFQLAFKNAQRAEDEVFSLTCLNNIGSTQKHLKNYEEGLQSLDAGLHKLTQLNQEIDQAIKERATPKMLADPEVQNMIAELRNLPTIRRMQYHKVGCLKGLKRKEEADALAKQLWQEGIEANDTRLLEDLRKEGYDFGE